MFGYSPRVTEERIRFARCLQRLPRLDEALRRGELCFSVIKEVTRVAVPDTEVAWLDAVRGKSVREVEGMVSERDRGEDPDRPPRPRPCRHVLRFEVQEEIRAMLREARKVAIRDAGHGLSDDELLQLMARALVRVSEQAASSEATAPAYQVHMTVCEQCGQGHVVGGGCKGPVREAVVAAAMSDAVVVPAGGGSEPPLGGVDVGAAPTWGHPGRPRHRPGPKVHPRNDPAALRQLTAGIVTARDDGLTYVAPPMGHGAIGS